MTAMRRILTLVALVVGCLAVMAPSCAPAEPPMTITAKTPPSPWAFTDATITGNVTPATATTKVVLQRTVGGKWVDWQSCPAPGCVANPPRVPRGNVDQVTGAYTITYPTQWCTVELHLRVRSLGGAYFSPGFYVQSKKGC